MKKSKNRQKALSLFSKEAMKRLRKDKFNGRLIVLWENGMVKDFNLRTNFRFFVGKAREDFFMEDL
ncbi:MAG: hypothetical protein V1818_01920 [Candidatus Aenigmatarchaeota archaeon]